LDYPPTFRATEFDILAKTDKEDIIIDHEFDPYSSAQDAFMVITSHNDSKKNKTTVDFSQDKINIRLPIGIFENYQSLNKSHSDILHSSIVLPVLCQAVSNIQNKEESFQYEELVWYQRLNQIILVNKLENLDALSTSFRILDEPINRGIKYLSNKSMRDNEDIY